MNDSNENTWYSGDWKDSMNSSPPYNGMKIVPTTLYINPTSPPSSQKFVSATLNIVDYTYDKNGVGSLFTLDKTGVWYTIQIPENQTASPPQPNSDFTIVGLDSSTLGKVRLVVSSSGIYLEVQFRYGIATSSREEIGYVLKFASIFTEGQDPIQVG